MANRPLSQSELFVLEDITDRAPIPASQQRQLLLGLKRGLAAVNVHLKENLSSYDDALFIKSTIYSFFHTGSHAIRRSLINKEAPSYIQSVIDFEINEERLKILFDAAYSYPKIERVYLDGSIEESTFGELMASLLEFSNVDTFKEG